MSWIRQRRALREATQSCYGDLLKTALSPVYYAKFGVPDTMEGRAGWLSVLACVMIVRLQDIHSQFSMRLQSRLNEAILDGFDAAYRERGVGDASIARKVRKLASYHYGMGKSVVSELHKTEPKPGLTRVLVRNAIAPAASAEELANVLLVAMARFRAQSDESVLSGQFDWPDGDAL